MEQQEPANGEVLDAKKDTGFAGWLKRLWRSLTGGITNDLTTGPRPTTGQPQPGFNKPYEDFEENLKRLGEELAIPELQDNFRANKRFFLESGCRDGAIGADGSDITAIAETHAQNLFDQANVIIKSKLAALETELEAAERIKKRDEENDKEQHAYYNYLQHGYRYFPRTFSLSLGVIYFISFLVLLLADIPLALRLIIDGFNLHSDDKLPELFTGNTMEIIKSNWEVFTTAIGIAMCTVYIKIFYDEFIGTPYGNKYLSKSKFLEVSLKGHHPGPAGSAEDNRALIDKENKRKQLWKYFIAAITVAALIALALFRIHTISLYVIDDKTFETVLPQVPNGWQRDAAVIAITLLFPIISGICLSLSLTSFQNASRYRKTGNDCTESSNRFIESLKRYTEIKREFENLSTELKNWNSDNKLLENHIHLLVAHYKYGRSIGITQPDLLTRDKDFFDKVKLWREKVTARRINTKIIQANTK